MSGHTPGETGERVSVLKAEYDALRAAITAYREETSAISYRLHCEAYRWMKIADAGSARARGTK